MASAKQVAANKLNSLKSSGPKNKQSVRFNALRHGLRAKTLVLPDENQVEFDALLQDLEIEFQPQTPAEFIQVERMAVNYWKLARADRREAFFRLNEMPDRFVDQSFKFQQGHERAFDRALQCLDRLQKTRCGARASALPLGFCPAQSANQECTPISEDSIPALIEEPPQPQPVGQEVILRADSQSAQPEPPQPPSETAQAAISSATAAPTPSPAASAHPYSAVQRRYLRKQSAEIEKRENELMKAGYLRSADWNDYPTNPILPPRF